MGWNLPGNRSWQHDQRRRYLQDCARLQRFMLASPIQQPEAVAIPEPVFNHELGDTVTGEIAERFYNRTVTGKIIEQLDNLGQNEYRLLLADGYRVYITEKSIIGERET